MSASYEPAPPTVDELLALKAARALDERALRTLFLEARTANGFLPRPVPHDTIERAFELAELGPTSANTLPLRIVFVESPEAKARLVATLSPGNVEKTKAAPLTAIFAADTKFYEHIPRLFPNAPQFKNLFTGEDKAEFSTQFALMNATLQGAYFMLAARALGLDVGPMGGFDKKQLDAAFFPEGTLKSIWIANLGYGDDTKLYPRNPRFNFDEVARFA
ncbi:MAG: malonic semialdehyde reductase [Candidatus Baltobacteraceae bacterium]|jgi:3-hydroxypropanoate dehydrogenase